jgi:hypothetical protein
MDATEYPGAAGYSWFTRSHPDTGLDRSEVFTTLADAMAWPGLANHGATTPYLLVAILPDSARSEMAWDSYHDRWIPNQWPAFPGPPQRNWTGEVDLTTFHCLRSSEEAH